MAEDNKLTTKICFKCGVDKALSEFYRHQMMSDGHLNKCKECNKIDVKQNRKLKLEYYRSYDRNRGSRQTAEYIKRYKDSFPKKAKARNAVGNAVRDKKLIKPSSCQECGSVGKVHGHHNDYDHPLDVRWLCPACHKQWHMENGEGKNGS